MVSFCVLSFCFFNIILLATCVQLSGLFGLTLGSLSGYMFHIATPLSVIVFGTHYASKKAIQIRENQRKAKEEQKNRGNREKEMAKYLEYVKKLCCFFLRSGRGLTFFSGMFKSAALNRLFPKVSTIGTVVLMEILIEIFEK